MRPSVRVFRNVGTTILDALNRAFPPNLTSLTITSFKNIPSRLFEFWKGRERRESRPLFSLSLALTLILSYGFKPSVASRM